MKKKLSFLLLIVFTSCYSIKEVSPKEYNYNQHIDFIINKIEEKQSISDSPRSNGTYQSNINDKFVLIHMTIINSSEKRQEFNFNNVYLFDPKTNTKYRADWTISSSIMKKNRDISHFIKEKRSINRTLVFMFPNNEKAQYLKINNQLIDIKFQS